MSGEIISHALWLQKEGYRRSTILSAVSCLKSVAKKVRADDEIYYATEDEWKPKEYGGDAVGDFMVTGLAGVVAGAVLAGHSNRQHVKNRPVRENLIETLSEDPQYAEAFKEWWTKAYPSKVYSTNDLLTFTKEQVRSGYISFRENGINFEGEATALGNLYREKRAISQS